MASSSARTTDSISSLTGSRTPGTNGGALELVMMRYFTKLIEQGSPTSYIPRNRIDARSRRAIVPKRVTVVFHSRVGRNVKEDGPSRDIRMCRRVLIDEFLCIYANKAEVGRGLHGHGCMFVCFYVCVTESCVTKSDTLSPRVPTHIQLGHASLLVSSARTKLERLLLSARNVSMMLDTVLSVFGAYIIVTHLFVERYVFCKEGRGINGRVKVLVDY